MIKIEIKKESAIELENLARYICCILPKKDSMVAIQRVRSGRKSLCKALGIEYRIQDEIDS